MAMEIAIGKSDQNQKEAEQNQKNTLTLLDYFVIFNGGKAIPSPLGEIDEKIVVNAIKKGIKLGEIVFNWEKDPGTSQTPTVSQVEREGKKQVQVITSPSLLGAIENDVQKLLPGGVIPVIENKAGYIRDVFKKLKGKIATPTEDRHRIIPTFSKVYELYLQI